MRAPFDPMNPRFLWKGKISILILLLLLISGCRTGNQPEGREHDHESGTSAGSLLFAPLTGVIRQHIQEGTHYDGPRCPMYPSCAHWGDRALREHGFYGFLLLLDRMLYRERGVLREKYPVAPAHLSRHIRFYDPLWESFPGAEDSRPSLLREDFAPGSR